MWGTNEVDWVENGVENNAEGLITMWRKCCFLLSNFINGKNYSIIEREWRIEEPIQITIVDVYNSDSLEEKRSVWEKVRESRTVQGSKTWCVVETNFKL